ncbi:MAG: TIM barrel protein [Planctomycetes bacterium]|nr:TIM barrel protein [Planctomycetota bacterium]
MELHLYRHLWGVGPANDAVLGAIAGEGIYTGIETGLPAEADEGPFRDLLARHRLRYLAMAFTAGADPAAHLAALRADLARARRLGAVLVNVHSGSDAWDQRTAAAFLRDAVAAGRDSGLAVVHETHRGRILFHPRLSAELCEQVPGLELCADFSHFAVVCERHPDDSELAALLPRVRRIHARVGHPEGPQVNDPRAPEHRDSVAAHERWWDAIWAAQRAAGQAVTTLTPEFGPPGYLQTLPYTGQPVADLAAVCAWQARRQRERFAARGH